MSTAGRQDAGSPARGVLLAGLSAAYAASVAHAVPDAAVQLAYDAEGVRESVAGDGWAAVVATDGLPDLALPELVARMRSDAKGARLPVIVSLETAGRTPDPALLRRLGGELWVGRILMMPVDGSELAGAVANAMRVAPPVAFAPPQHAGMDATTVSGVARSQTPDPVGRANPAAMAAMIAAAWERFREPMLEWVATIGAAATAAVAGTLDGGLLRRAEHEAHKLAGSLGTFGIPDGSVVARRARSAATVCEWLPTPRRDRARCATPDRTWWWWIFPTQTTRPATSCSMNWRVRFRRFQRWSPVLVGLWWIGCG